MRGTMNITGLMILGILTCTFSLSAGDPAPADQVGGLAFVDRLEVTVVSVDVHVRDKKGNPVTGLSPSDFRVSQDGAIIPVTYFQEMTPELFSTVLQAAPDQPLTLPPQKEVAALEIEIKPIYVVLYIDNENLHPMKRNRVLRQVREFVTENLAPPVQMMVVAYQRSVRVLQPFTDDPHAINSALRAVKTYTGGRVERDSERAKIIDMMHDATAQDYGSTGRDTSLGAKNRMYQHVVQFSREEAHNLGFTLAALRQIVGSLAGLDGRKSLIYVSNGLPMSPGLGLMHEYAIRFEDTSILARRSQFDKSTDFRSLTTAANSQNVTLYTIDAEGLETLGGTSAEDRYGTDPTASSIGRTNYQASMRYMAERTGGIAIINTNDPTKGLLRVRDDLFAFYSLGYTSPVSWTDKVHKIDVSIPEHKSYDLRYRQRFVEKSLETRTQERVQSALLYDVSDNPMYVEINFEKAAPGTGDHWLVPVKISFPLRKIALLPEDEDLVGHVVLFVDARDDQGKESGVQRQVHEIRIKAADYEATKGQHFTINSRLLMAEGSHRIAVGLLDTITRSTSYRTALKIVP